MIFLQVWLAVGAAYLAIQVLGFCVGLARGSVTFNTPTTVEKIEVAVREARDMLGHSILWPMSTVLVLLGLRRLDTESLRNIVDGNVQPAQVTMAAYAKSNSTQSSRTQASMASSKRHG